MLSAHFNAYAHLTQNVISASLHLNVHIAHVNSIQSALLLFCRPHIFERSRDKYFVGGAGAAYIYMYIYIYIDFSVEALTLEFENQGRKVARLRSLGVIL